MIPRTRLILGNNREFTDALKDMGYDGTIQSEYGDEAVAFYPNQIKSVDPVTYDDEGNVIPLQQRFNSENEDIRHSPKNSVDNFAEKDYNYFTESEEFYKLFPTEAARGTFRRSLANKTNGMRDGETKTIYVVGYIFEATGYLQGEIIAEYSNKTKHLLEVNRSDYNTIGEDKETVALWVENVRDADRRSGSDSDLSNGG